MALVEEIFKKEFFNIQNIKKVQNKGLVSVCYKEEVISKLVTSITEKEDLAAKIETKAPGKRHPSLIVCDIPNSTTEKELQQAIVDCLVLPNPLEIRFKLRGKEQDTSHWVMEAPRKVIKKIKITCKIALNWTRHRMRKFSHLILARKEYEEESAKEWLNTITKERTEKEGIAEQRRQEEIEQRKQVYEERKRKDEMEFELQKIRLGAKEGKPEHEATPYRPTSLQPTIGKVLENLLTPRLNYHLERLNKISDNQYGFRKGCSAKLEIHHLIQKINEGKKKNPHFLVLSIDSKGAFDNIRQS
ncbi:hypothetical protein AVEN_262861-1 [Araneus ventricosus]|uniref:Reverse transcriptase domain-containing protein n=1 Tax=Araneus ventricosus TaxID=182803 RepID=A0A4Y2DFU8_ARAVE|nr:hypothetical protein AVEN_262861-1 [Araneus ventricosus]